MTRPALGWSDLRRAYRNGAKIGVWGLGKEGQATVRKLRTLAVAPVLVDDRPNESGVLPTAGGGLDALKACAVVIKTPGISAYRAEADELRAAGRVAGAGAVAAGEGSAQGEGSAGRERKVRSLRSSSLR